MPKASASPTPKPASRTVTVRAGPASSSQNRSAAAPSTAAGTRRVTVPQPEDLAHAEKDALLQLRIGRSAHLYTVAVSSLLALDGILLLFFFPQLPRITGGESAVDALLHSFYLILPLAAGIALAAIGLAAKWEVFQLWPWEPHFSTSVGAFAVNLFLAVVYALRITRIGPFAGFALFPEFYVAELVGISLALLGFVLTWSGWSGRQWAAGIAAVLPIATGLFAYLPPTNTAGLSDALAVSLFLSAILYQTSGSFLHLISSGTRPHERELITSGQSRMFRIADEIRQREEALRFRESAIVKREAEVENGLLSVRRQNDSLKAAREQLDALEEDYRKRSDSVGVKERETVVRAAESDARLRLVDDKLKALELREQEIARLLPQISSREQRLVQREGEQTKRDVELTQRHQDLDRRETAVQQTEARVESRRKELDQKTQDLLRREGEIASREAAAPGAPAPPGAASPDLASRELKLQQFKTVLDEQNAILGRRAQEIGEQVKAANAALQRSADKEAQLASREAALHQREAELADLLKAADERRTQYDNASKEYAQRIEEQARRSAEAAQLDADLEQRRKMLAEKDGAISAREERLRSAASELDRREQELTRREASLRAAEAEVSLRRQAAARGDLSFAGLAALAAAEGLDGAPATHDRRGQRSRGQAPPEAAPEGAVADGAEEAQTLATPSVRRFADRLPSGNPRLDDLLLGGVPPKGHVVLVGDAFVGKEVVLYSFLAEGLKRGEPVVLVTAARSPNEVSQALGVVLPQFREYEQMGMVQWIDASGSNATPDEYHTVLKSSDDRPGILSSLVKAATRSEGSNGQAFRVGFLGLSAVLAHGDERASFSFLQNVVGILKPRNALAMYSLEAGALSEPQVETLLSRMDGAIVFRQDRDRLLLSVKGFGDVETRDWVECRATQRALVIGSFALERIR